MKKHFRGWIALIVIAIAAVAIGVPAASAYPFGDEPDNSYRSYGDWWNAQQLLKQQSKHAKHFRMKVHHSRH
jgi:hypothetical protein